MMVTLPLKLPSRVRIVVPDIWLTAPVDVAPALFKADFGTKFDAVWLKLTVPVLRS